MGVDFSPVPFSQLWEPTPPTSAGEEREAEGWHPTWGHIIGHHVSFSLRDLIQGVFGGF